MSPIIRGLSSKDIYSVYNTVNTVLGCHIWCL